MVLGFRVADYLRLAGNEGMEKNMETTMIDGCIGAIATIHSFLPS